MHNFTTSNKLIRVEAGAVAGTSDLTSDVVDMQGYDTATFLWSVGAITSGAVTSLNIYGHTANAASGALITGATVTIADTDDDKVAVCEVTNPTKRYIYAVLDRGTQNAVSDGCICILSNGKGKPATHGTGIIEPELVVGA